MASKRRPQTRSTKRPRAKKTRPASADVPRTPKHRAPRPSSLSAAQLEIRAGVFGAHADMMRDPKLSAARAAEDNGVGVPDLWRYAPKAFKKGPRGRIRAVADRYVRRMETFGPNGPIFIKIRGSRAATQIAQFRNDAFSFLAGNVTALDKWKGLKIQGYELPTDPQIILRAGEQDRLPEHFGSEQVIPYSGGGR